MRHIRLLAFVAIGLTACGSSSALQVDDVWARTSASMQDAGAVYMTIDGGDESDRLLAASVDKAIAMDAQVHMSEMVEADDGSQMMSMHEVDAIDIPAGQQVMLEPGGYHIMLMKLAEPLIDGSEFEVTLTFENAGEMQVTVEVRDG